MPSYTMVPLVLRLQHMQRLGEALLASAAASGVAVL